MNSPAISHHTSNSSGWCSQVTTEFNSLFLAVVPGVLVRTGGTEANVTGGEFTGTKERQRDRLGS
jgi:hypothetical protein